VKLLNAEITRIAKSKEMVDRIEKSGSVPLYATPEEFAEMVSNEAKLWQDLFENVDLQSFANELTARIAMSSMLEETHLAESSSHSSPRGTRIGRASQGARVHEGGRPHG